jgi:hypothetical protein
LCFLSFHVAAGHSSGRQLRNDPIDLVIQIRRFFGRPGNDERRSRFIDQDAVHFVDNREVVTPLHVVREVELHVVAQVVEPELVVGAVRDVARVGDLALLVVQIVLDDTHRHPEEAIDPSHPLGVAPGQVIVDRDHVDAFAREGIEVGGKRRDERLAFARLHLRDLSAMEHHAANQLHVEVPHVQRATPSLADDGEGFRQQILQ